MPYKCRACGNIQDSNDPCNGLMHPGGWYDNMMDMVESNKKMAREMNVAFYGDGGCCGCNRKKRRIMLFVIAVIAVIAAGVLAVTDYDANQENCLAFLVGGGAFAIAGACCPDGCCGEYRRGAPVYRQV